MTSSMYRIIEKQMTRWRIQSKASEVVVRGKFVPPNVVTISNAYGSNGVQIAHKVGELLGIPAYDREIVEHIATTAKVQTEAVDTLDETVQTQLDEYITSLFSQRNFDQSDYARALTRTIMALWGHGPCVLIGRGACHIVYRKNALSVRITASEDFRKKFIQGHDGLDAERALQHMRRMDAQREAFIRRYFVEHIDNPLSYDLTINRTGMSDEICAEIIVEAFRKKTGGLVSQG